MDPLGSPAAEDNAWPADGGARAPGEGEVHVWLVPLPAAPAAEDVRLLSLDEHARANAFRFERDRARYARARAALRRLLGAQLGCRPEGLRFLTGPAGKPFLASDGLPVAPVDLRFNVSHSHEIALIAFARGVEVGVDVEHRRDNLEMVDIAQRYFTPAEAEQVRQAPPADRARVFFTCWTRKEACMKALGFGLQLEPNSFQVGGETPPAVATLTLAHDGALHPLALYRVPGIMGYEAAFAVCGPARIQPRFWRA